MFGKLVQKLLPGQGSRRTALEIIGDARRISIPSPPLQLGLHLMFCVNSFCCAFAVLVHCWDNLPPEYCFDSRFQDEWKRPRGWLKIRIFYFIERELILPKFLQEEWALYGIGAVVLLLRFATRLKTVGLRGFQGDDYMSILVLALFTIDAATVHIICRYTYPSEGNYCWECQDYAGTNVEASALQQTRSKDIWGRTSCNCWPRI